MKNRFNKKWLSAGLGLCLLAFAAHQALYARGDYNQYTKKQGKLNYIVEGMFQVSKPNESWVTEDSHQDNSPVKWALHISGDNPEVRLRYDFNPKGSDAFKYGVHVKDQLKSRGINIENVYRRTINGQKATIIKGIDRSREKRWLVGVWRNRDRGFLLECSIEPETFNKYQADFYDMINSVYILK